MKRQAKFFIRVIRMMTFYIYNIYYEFMRRRNLLIYFQILNYWRYVIRTIDRVASDTNYIRTILIDFEMYEICFNDWICIYVLSIFLLYIYR